MQPANFESTRLFLSLFFHFSIRSVTPRDNEALWCVCMCWRKGGGCRGGVWGRVTGERWCRSLRSTGVAVAVRWSGGGWSLMLTLALIETSHVTKTSLTARLNGAAVTEQPASAPRISRPLLPSRLKLPAFSFMAPVLFTYFFYTSQCRGSV